MYKEIIDFFNRFSKAKIIEEKPSYRNIHDNIFYENRWVNIYGRNEASLLLRSVLSEQTAPHAVGGQEADIDENSENSLNLKKKIKIGEVLSKNTESLLDYGRQLSSLTDQATQHYINQALSLLENQVCHIAFLGQMNAGKSSLINAFIQQPGLLPTDINPWTTVVTNLHFGTPNSPKKGALFHFFGRDEWQKLAEGGGRVRELTERLIPDFDWRHFLEQLSSMRSNAEKKLGPSFDDLLGKQHWFDEPTPEILAKYVSAGSPFEDQPQNSAGEYSDITKMADLYFDLGAFSFPTTVIDTPGINDPFLVRDEITRQNLERADIYVIVVTARQPLSSADLDLLRILRGLNKERIIIFINKIDEFENIDKFSEEIVKRVQGLLQKEFPSIDIPVVFGSALWANAALASDQADFERYISSTAFRPHAEKAMTIIEAGDELWAQDTASKQELMADALLTHSGLPTLGFAVSEFMRRGPIFRFVTDLARLLLALAKNMEACVQRQLNDLSEIVAEGRAAGGARLQKTDKLMGELEQIADLHRSIEASLMECEAELSAIKENGLKALREAFGRIITKFAAQEANTLLDLIKSNPSRIGQCNVLPLRLALEREFLQHFDEICDRITNGHEKTAQKLSELVRGSQLASSLGITCEASPVFKLSPSLSALSDHVTVDVGNPSWPQWWAQTRSPEERASEIEKIIKSDFSAIADKLIQSADRELNNFIRSIREHFEVMMFSMITQVRQEQEALLEACRSLDGQDEPARNQLLDDLETKLGDCRARLSRYEALISNLAALSA